MYSYQLSRRLIAVYFIFLIACTACKKETTNPGSSAKPSPLVTVLKIDSVTQGSFDIHYQLSISASSTGIKWDTDSIGLLDNANGTQVIASSENGLYRCTISNLNKSSKYYFKIFAIDGKGTTTYSAIYNQSMVLYSVQNSFVDAGPFNLNNTRVNNSGALIVSAYITDTSRSKYTVKINGVVTPIVQIYQYPGFAISSLYIDVPPSTALGTAQLEIDYLGKISYSTNLTIVNGGLLTTTQHPGIFAGGSYFTYNNQLYTYLFNQSLYPSDTKSFWRWTPATNTWEHLPDPTYNAQTLRSNGYEINDIIYFAPYDNYIWDSDDTTKNSYDEIIPTYTPATGTWQDLDVYHTNIRAQGEGCKYQ